MLVKGATAVAIHESRLKPDRACVACPSKGCKSPSTPCGHSTRVGHGPASRVEQDGPRNMSQYCSVDEQAVPGSPTGSRRTYPLLMLLSRFSEHSNESYPGQNNHLLWNHFVTTFVFIQRFPSEVTIAMNRNFVCFPKWTFFKCFVSYALLLDTSFTRVMCWCILLCQSIVVVAMWTSFFRKSKFSQFLFPEKFGTLKIANMQSFCSGVYIRHDHLQNRCKKK